MDFGEHRGGTRICKFDNFKERTLWNMLEYQNPVQDQNTLHINRRLSSLIAERDAAFEERDRAVLEKRRAMEERELAVSQRNMAIKERDNAIMDRNNALHALHDSMQHPLSPGLQRGTNRLHLPYMTDELQILDALCRTAVASECNGSPQPKKAKEIKGCVWKPKREKWTCNQLKVKNNWEDQNMGLGLNRVEYDESIMPIPGCSCTGVFRQCYKWGNGGWQSSCCTTTLSVYPLPVVPNKRYARLGGRKMSGSAFSKLLSRLALQGFDFSMPVDLKDHWSKHGTNRYITIK